MSVSVTAYRTVAVHQHVTGVVNPQSVAGKDAKNDASTDRNTSNKLAREQDIFQTIGYFWLNFGNLTNCDVTHERKRKSRGLALRKHSLVLDHQSRIFLDVSSSPCHRSDSASWSAGQETRVPRDHLSVNALLKRVSEEGS